MYILTKQLQFHKTAYVVLTSTSSTIKINGNSNQIVPFIKLLNMGQQSSIL